MQPELSPSGIVRRGLHIPPSTGVVWKGPEPTLCVTCGATIAPGGRHVPWTPSRGSFTDWMRLATIMGDVVQTWHVCTDCAPLLGNEGLKATASAVINCAGAWSLKTDAQRAWFLRTPPKTPFVACISDAMKQHTAWPATVTVDPALLCVQLGRRCLTVNRALLAEAEEWCIEAADLARENGARLTTRHPYARLDREAKEPDHGVLRTDIQRLARRVPRLQMLLDHLTERIGDGELWALAHLVKKTPPVPECQPLSRNSQ